MITFTGRRIDVLDPHPEQIDIRDIAHALANQCRFAGHTRVFYSVADHSIRVAGQLPMPHRLGGLLHDATEAYLGDAISPLKRVLPELVALEETWWTAIATHFALPRVLPPAVKLADSVLLATELRDLTQAAHTTAKQDPLPIALDEPIVPLTADEAEDVFLRLFAYYSRVRTDSAQPQELTP
ncbi:phosphohydrolase [Trinickia violacea]|nr:phosphohydrolase [Trinickia violacea]